MADVRLRWFLIFACAITLNIGVLSGQQPGQTGGPPAPGPTKQPEAGGAVRPVQPGSTGGTVDAGSSQADPNAILKATNAREIATVSCTTGDGDTCFDATTKNFLNTINQRFNGTLLGADGKDSSPLSQAIKSFLTAKITAPEGPTSVWDLKVPYALVHLVTYDQSDNVHDKWILAKAGKHGSIELSDSLHIPGARRIALIFVHFHANVPLENGGKKTVSRDDALKFYNDVSYRAIVEKKLPINVQNLLSLLKLATGNLQAAGEKGQVTLVGFGVIEHVDVPSDVTVFGAQISSSSKLIGQSQKYDNEGKYFWDVSVAVPVNKLSLLDYSTDSGGTYIPKTINKQSLYAVVDIYPDLVDLKYGNKRWFLPRAIGGIGVTGRPGENFLVGGAWGIKELQFFVGSGFANHRVLRPGANPSVGSSYVQRYASHLTYGVNVPVLAAIKKMGSASKSKQ